MVDGSPPALTSSTPLAFLTSGNNSTATSPERPLALACGITASVVAIVMLAIGALLWWRVKSKCAPCECPPCKKPLIAAYYAFYQDPNCSGDCDAAPCTKTILSDPTVLASNLDLVVINPIAPATAGGVTLSYINKTYTGKASASNTYYDPPPPIKQGIADLQKHGKRVSLSFIPGSDTDQWGDSDAWFRDFKDACQKIMTKWNIDGFDWDCEGGNCPPTICGGSWTDTKCQQNALNIFKTLKSLKPNPGRGNDDGTAVVTWTGELTWGFTALKDASPYLPYVDYFMAMNENYSVLDPQVLYTNMKNFSKKGWPTGRIVNGVKVGGCWPGTNGDGGTADQVRALMTTAVNNTKTLTDVGAGWIIWNLSRDYGCTGGRTTTPASDDGTPSKTCMTCKDVACPKGTGSFSAGPSFSFLKLVQSTVAGKN